MLVVDVVPTVAVTAKGVKPERRSSSIAAASAAGIMRYSASTGTFRKPF
jgi:hypothetical protein